MRGSAESKVKYLALALTSRKSINSLRAVADGSPVPKDLEETLVGLLAGAEPAEHDRFVSHLQASAPWTNFEELSTIDELKSETGTTDLSLVLTTVLREHGDTARQSAKRLIDFLTAVEARALQRYTESTEPQFA